MISELQKPIGSGFGAKSEPTEVLEGIDLNGKVDIKKSNGFLTPLKDSTFQLKHNLTKENNG